MSHFAFKAKKPDGQIYASERDAADRFELYRLLRDSGDEIVSYQEKGSSHKIKLASFMNLFGSVSMVDKINFARNLGSMLEAGLALARALAVLEKQTKNAKLKKILGGVISDITSGSTFADALGKYQNVFPPIMVSMVHAGEQSGTLAESLKVIALQMDNTHTLERKVRGALIYPAVIVCIMVIIAILMFIFVVPTLMKTFTELHTQLPFTTQIVLNISNLIKDQGLWVLIVFLIVAGGIYYWSRLAAGKKVTHYLAIKLPVIGGLVTEVNAARTARTLSSLLGAGVDVVESVTITAQVIQNIYFRNVLVKAAEAIKNGELMSKVFNQYINLYPIFLVEMITVGEETGKVKDMLLGVAHFYEDDVDQKTKDMSTIIEPFLMVIIGAAVGFFAISMISPMYSLVGSM